MLSILRMYIQVKSTKYNGHPNTEQVSIDLFGSQIVRFCTKELFIFVQWSILGLYSAFYL